MEIMLGMVQGFVCCGEEGKEMIIPFDKKGKGAN